MSNEAAERLLDHLMDQVGPSWQRKPALESVQRALAAERRATVERIRAALPPDSEGPEATSWWLPDITRILDAILDAEAER
jgi:hypothetical protein